MRKNHRRQPCLGKVLLCLIACLVLATWIKLASLNPGRKGRIMPTQSRLMDAAPEFHPAGAVGPDYP